MSRHHTPDDQICRPASFLSWKSDGSCEKTFTIRSEWVDGKQHQIGELKVWEAHSGELISIDREVK